nr:hypothetical protein [uncultured Blautia sp.]
MSKNENHVSTMYERIPAVAALNQVPGFEPAKLLRRTISSKTKEEVLRLDLPYKKLWFRLANPKGRIRLNALRITEQLAIFEAQVFLDRSDTEPIGSFTSCCTKEEASDGQYIQAAQREAMNEALSDAGYGLQFADVSMDEEERRYGSEIPLQKKADEKKPLEMNKTITEKPLMQNKASVDAAAGKKMFVQTVSVPKPESKPEELPVKITEDTLPVSVNPAQERLSFEAETLPVTVAAEMQTEKAEQEVLSAKKEQQVETALEDKPKYTMDMPVEQILERMTLEEAQEVVVDTGVCNGWKIRDVAERRAASLKFYVYGGYKGPNNILRAAARLALDALAGQKAG